MHHDTDIIIRRKAIAGWSDSYAWLYKLELHTKLIMQIYELYELYELFNPHAFTGIYTI